MTMNPANSACLIVMAALAAACTGGDRAPGEEAAQSIILQEKEPGICVEVLFEDRNAGFTGAGYINTPNAKAGRIEWSVSSPEGGDYTLEFRYANGGDAPRPGALSLNDDDGAVDVPLPPTGGWDQWATATVSLALTPGENKLVLRAVTDSGLANIDSLTVTGADPSPGSCGKPASPTKKAPVDLSAVPLGWATEGDGVTGGGEAAPVIVSTMSELQKAVAGDAPGVIHVDGQLKGALSVGSNKTIIGLQGARIENDGTVLRLDDARNVIIKNLTLKGAHRRGQPNTVLHNAKNVWLDHNTFIDGQTDLLLLSGTTDFVTLSWNEFRHTLHGHEHMGVNIGEADGDAESAGHLRVTLHHNLYDGLINERMPRVRFGKVHSFNNLCVAGDDALTRAYYAVRAGVDADILSERNIYKGFIGPSWWWTSEKLGAENSTVFNYARGNAASVLQSVEDVCTPDCVEGPIDIAEHEGVTGKAGFYSKGEAFTPPYIYEADPTDGLEAIIRAGAGAR